MALFLTDEDTPFAPLPPVPAQLDAHSLQFRHVEYLREKEPRVVHPEGRCPHELSPTSPPLLQRAMMMTMMDEASYMTEGPFQAFIPAPPFEGDLELRGRQRRRRHGSTSPNRSEPSICDDGNSKPSMDDDGDDGPRQLIVNYLPESLTAEGLFAIFRRFGEVEHASIVTERESGASRGFGFVHMRSHRDAETAIAAASGRVLQRKRVRVSYARAQNKSVE